MKLVRTLVTAALAVGTLLAVAAPAVADETPDTLVSYQFNPCYAPTGPDNNLCYVHLYPSSTTSVDQIVVTGTLNGFRVPYGKSFWYGNGARAVVVQTAPTPNVGFDPSSYPDGTNIIQGAPVVFTSVEKVNAQGIHRLVTTMTPVGTVDGPRIAPYWALVGASPNTGIQATAVGSTTTDVARKFFYGPDGYQPRLVSVSDLTPVPDPVTGVVPALGKIHMKTSTNGVNMMVFTPPKNAVAGSSYTYTAVVATYLTTTQSSLRITIQ